MVLIYFTGEAYPNCLMFVSCHTITERILESNLIETYFMTTYDHSTESCKNLDSMICVRFSKTTIFRKIFCTILQDHTRFCFKIMHGRTRIVYDQRVWLLAMGLHTYDWFKHSQEFVQSTHFNRHSSHDHVNDCFGNNRGDHDCSSDWINRPHTTHHPLLAYSSSPSHRYRSTNEGIRVIKLTG